MVDHERICRTNRLIRLANLIDESDELNPCRLYGGSFGSSRLLCRNKRVRGFHTCDYDRCIVDMLFDISDFLDTNGGVLR